MNFQRGFEDPCAGRADEQNCGGLSFPLLVASVGAAVTLGSLMLALLKVIPWKTANSNGEYIPSQEMSLRKQLFRPGCNGAEDFFTDFSRQPLIIKSILLYYSKMDVGSAHALCNRLYAALARVFAIESVDNFLYQQLGTNDAIALLYSNVDNGFLVRLKVLIKGRAWQKKWPCAPLKPIATVLVYIFKMTLHYLDLVKDVAIIWIMMGYVTDSRHDEI